MLGVEDDGGMKNGRAGSEVNRGLAVNRPGPAGRRRIVPIVRGGGTILIRRAVADGTKRRTARTRRRRAGELEMSASGVSPHQEPARLRSRDDVQVAVVVDIAEDEGVDAFREVQQARACAMDEPDRDQRAIPLRMKRDGMDAPLVARMGCGNAGNGNRQQDEECSRNDPLGNHVQTIPRLKRGVKAGGWRLERLEVGNPSAQLQLRAQRLLSWKDHRREPDDRLSSRPSAGSRGGKSELRRAVRRVTPGRGNPKESGTENTPPAFAVGSKAEGGGE